MNPALLPLFLIGLIAVCTTVEGTKYHSLVAKVDYKKLEKPDNCHRLCKGVIYDIRFEFCYHGKVYDKGIYNLCRLKGGVVVYKNGEKLCIQKRLYSRKYYGTCFGKLIDHRKEFCWAGGVFKKTVYRKCGRKVCRRKIKVYGRPKLKKKYGRRKIKEYRGRKIRTKYGRRKTKVFRGRKAKKKYGRRKVKMYRGRKIKSKYGRRKTKVFPGRKNKNKYVRRKINRYRKPKIIKKYGRRKINRGRQTKRKYRNNKRRYGDSPATDDNQETVNDAAIENNPTTMDKNAINS